jgi:hypothetical protein
MMPRYMRDVTNQPVNDKNFLRQTVSNATTWQLRNSTSPSPIKLLPDFKMERKKTSYATTSFRKKIESEYTPAFPP